MKKRIFLPLVILGGIIVYLVVKKFRPSKDLKNGTSSPMTANLAENSVIVSKPIDNPIIDYDLTNVYTGIYTPIMEMLNQVDLSFIEDFDIPLHPVTGEPIFSNLYAGPNYRSQVSNPLKKGFSMIDASMMIEGVEKQTGNKIGNFVSTIPPKKRSLLFYSPQPNLRLDIDATANDILSVDYSAYNYIGGEMSTNIATFFDGSATKAEIGFVGLDIENGMYNVAVNDLVNRLVAIYEQFRSGCANYTKVSLLYQSSPITRVGFGVNRSDYSSAPEPYWTTPTSWTPNAISKNFPANLIGKTLNSLNYIECIVEYYLYFEAFQPEGTILKNIQGTNLRDWNGNDISNLTHFGLQIPSFFHYAAHTAAILQVQKPHLNGKTMRLQTNNFNIAGVGYWYKGNIENQPDNTKLLQCNDGLGRYYLPNKVIQAIELITFFTGARYYNWEATFNIEPVSRTAGKYFSRTSGVPSRLDYSGIAAQQAVIKELSTKKAVGSEFFSVADLIDGTEIYTDQHTKVDYLNVPNFSTVKEINPLDWKEFKLSPVLSIVNEAKRLVAILHFQAYDCEQAEVDYVYNSNGFNFKQRLQNTPGQIGITICKM